jgi:anti-sigma regulatory factor (Ser/Thr protein kinase)
MLHWIRETLMDIGFDESTIRKVELSSEEALVNIIYHAYRERKGDIQIQMAAAKNQVEIILIDQGPPFNPLEQQISAASQLPVEDLKEGGLGILFMKQYMDEIHYERKNGNNILTLIKKLKKSY